MNKTEVKVPETKETPAAVELASLLFHRSSTMTAEYRNSIKHTGGLLTSSMVYAYSKGLQDAMKLLLKEGNKNEKSVQEK